MTEPAPFTLKGRNPDALAASPTSRTTRYSPRPNSPTGCSIRWHEAGRRTTTARHLADSKVTFLDPCTKSGVFLREIAKRLIAGLETEIPDLQARVDHILTGRCSGIGITQ